MENTKTKIVLVKLYSGDYIIGEVYNNASQVGSYVMKNPRQIIMMPNMSGSMSVALKPVCFPFTSKRLKDEITIEKTQIMFTLLDELGEIEKEIINGYKSEITGIKIATAAESVSIGSNSNYAAGPIII